MALTELKPLDADGLDPLSLPAVNGIVHSAPARAITRMRLSHDFRYAGQHTLSHCLGHPSEAP